MAKTRRIPDPVVPDLTEQSDFQLLNLLAEIASKERSAPLQSVSWEIMRRYSAHLSAIPPAKPAHSSAKLGDARWGDAKRAEAIFGMKRGVLNSLAEHGLIKCKSLDQGRNGKRAKRLYDLVSIEEYLGAKS